MNKKIDGSSSREIDFYWRPGCPFCMSLESKLKKEDIKLNKFNIWEDESASAKVRSVANGNETVPTINVNGTFLVNPSMKEVVKLLS
ncbi:MAG: glutaredoxin family protein [Acidimicrobiia bacterium]|nr:glutaredoxin family protein [Acidimicrobiia bacterium]